LLKAKREKRLSCPPHDYQYSDLVSRYGESQSLPNTRPVSEIGSISSASIYSNRETSISTTISQESSSNQTQGMEATSSLSNSFNQKSEKKSGGFEFLRLKYAPAAVMEDVGLARTVDVKESKKKNDNGKSKGAFKVKSILKKKHLDFFLLLNTSFFPSYHIILT